MVEISHSVTIPDSCTGLEYIIKKAAPCVQLFLGVTGLATFHFNKYYVRFPLLVLGKNDIVAESVKILRRTIIFIEKVEMVALLFGIESIDSVIGNNA